MQHHIKTFKVYCPNLREEQKVYVYYGTENDSLVFANFNACNFVRPCPECDACKAECFKLLKADLKIE